MSHLYSISHACTKSGSLRFSVFRLLTDFVCLYTYEFWLSLGKIVRSSVILLLPLLTKSWWWPENCCSDDFTFNIGSLCFSSFHGNNNTLQGNLYLEKTNVNNTGCGISFTHVSVDCSFAQYLLVFNNVEFQTSLLTTIGTMKLNINDEWIVVINRPDISLSRNYC